MIRFEELNENDLKVIRGIHNVVKERGEDWRYPNGKVDGTYPEDATFDPRFTNTLFGGCFNLLEDGSGACIIGALAVDQGLLTARSNTAALDGDNWKVSYDVREAMITAQTRQDFGYVWGEALNVFNFVLRARIEDYDAALLDFLAK